MYIVDDVLINVGRVLSVNQSTNVFVFGDCSIKQKKWLTFSGGTDEKLFFVKLSMMLQLRGMLFVTIWNITLWRASLNSFFLLLLSSFVTVSMLQLLHKSFSINIFINIHIILASHITDIHFGQQNKSRSLKPMSESLVTVVKGFKNSQACLC